MDLSFYNVLKLTVSSLFVFFYAVAVVTSSVLAIGIISAASYYTFGDSKPTASPLMDTLKGSAKTVNPKGSPRGQVNITAYLGIPYAKLGPSGRFGKSMLREYQPGMDKSRASKPSCPQYPWSPIPRLRSISSANTDDCLYLNIWRPGLQGWSRCHGVRFLLMCALPLLFLFSKIRK